MSCSPLALVARVVFTLGILALLDFRADARQIPDMPVNLDFKQGKAGEAPIGWFLPPVVRSAGYDVKTVADMPKKGQNAALLFWNGKPSAPRTGFGNLMQAFDAAQYRGKRIKFRALVRVEGDNPQGRAQLWFRTDRPNRQTGFFDNMGNRPITSDEWKAYEIEGEIEPDAQMLNLGVILIGADKVWIADASLTILESQRRPDAPPKPLSKQGCENLVAFAKLYGYVRFFHPSDEAAKADWDKIAYTGVTMVEDAPEAVELAKRLKTLFHPIAPTLRVHLKQKPDVVSGSPLIAEGKKTQVVQWRHAGFGGGNIPAGQNIYSSKRDYADVVDGKMPDGYSDPMGINELDLSGGVVARIPHSLYVQDNQTYPKATEKIPELFAPQSGNDRNTRLADVVIAWNVFQHFYPYFDVVKTDWNLALSDALTAAATDKDDRAFLSTLRRLVAALHDGHGYVMHPNDQTAASPPFLVGRVEGKLVITRSFEKELKLEAGDVLLKVDGQDAETVYQKAESLVSGATPQWKRHRTLSTFLLGAEGSTLTLEVQRRDAAPIKTKVTRQFREPMREPRPDPITEIKPSIWYVDMDASRATVQDFLAALPKLEKARGIVFDMRGYPNDMAMAVLPHLTDMPITSANWNVPNITQPDREKWEWYTSRWNPIQPKEPRLKANIAFLTEGGAISYAESVMGIVENYKLGAIVGEATAGTNGNVNPFELPGGYRVIWTGMKVTKHNGSQHHGVGIVPTVPVERTIKGVMDERDEILDKAIEWVQKDK